MLIVSDPIPPLVARRRQSITRRDPHLHNGFVCAALLTRQVSPFAMPLKQTIATTAEQVPATRIVFIRTAPRSALLAPAQRRTSRHQQRDDADDGEDRTEENTAVRDAVHSKPATRLAINAGCRQWC